MLNISNKRGTKKCQIHHLMNATTTTTTTTTTMMMMIEMILKHKTTPFHLWHITTKVRRLQNLIHSTFSLLTNQSKQRHEITFEVKLKVETCCFTYEIQSALNFISTLFFLTFSNGYTSPAAFSFLMISALFFKVLESLRRQHGINWIKAFHDTSEFSHESIIINGSIILFIWLTCTWLSPNPDVLLLKCFFK